MSSYHLQEVDDLAILSSFLISILLNSIILAQIGLYWGKAPRTAKTAAVTTKPVDTKAEAVTGGAGSPQVRRRTQKVE